MPRLGFQGDFIPSPSAKLATRSTKLLSHSSRFTLELTKPRPFGLNCGQRDRQRHYVAVAMAALQTFYPFPRLAPELRIKIYKCYFLNLPRRVVEYKTKPMTAHNDIGLPINEPVERPAILSANRESREVALPLYDQTLTQCFKPRVVLDTDRHQPETNAGLRYMIALENDGPIPALLNLEQDFFFLKESPMSIHQPHETIYCLDRWMAEEALWGLKYLALTKDTWKTLFSEAPQAWTSLFLKMKGLTEVVIMIDFKLNGALLLKEKYLRKSKQTREEAALSLQVKDMLQRNLYWLCPRFVLHDSITTFVNETELGILDRRRARPLLASRFKGVFANKLNLEHYIRG